MNGELICKVSDVPINGLMQFEIAAGEKVCIANAGDRVFACQAFCPHEGFALCDGVFDGEALTCLEHLWQWNLREGGQAQGLAEAPLHMYDVAVVGDGVCLKR